LLLPCCIVTSRAYSQVFVNNKDILKEKESIYCVYIYIEKKRRGKERKREREREKGNEKKREAHRKKKIKN
jgi:hypothetical protein